MANKLLIVFILLNFLFAACGGLLLAVVLVTRNAQQSSQTISNVAQNLLLNHCPLIGKQMCLRSSSVRSPRLFGSRWNQRHPHLRHLRPLDPCHGLNHPSRDSPIPWLRCRLLCPFLYEYRLGHLVLDT